MPYYSKEHALREPTHLYSFTGLKVVHDNSYDNHQQTLDVKCSSQSLEPKNKEIKNTRQKSQKISNKQIPQKQRKNRNSEEETVSKETKEKSQQVQSSRLRSQPRKYYKTFIPQSEMFEKVENQNPFQSK